MPAPRFWRRLAVAVGGLLAFHAAAAVALPGIDLAAFSRFLAQARTGTLWWLYDRLGGDGLSRGSIIALGFMPYLSARVWVWLASTLIPNVRRLRERASGLTTLRQWTRGLTVVGALIQSTGLVQRLLQAPDVVLQPGLGSSLRLVAVLTGGAVAAMLIAESVDALVSGQYDAPADDASPSPTPHKELPEGAAPDSPALRTRTSSKVPR